MSDLEVIWHSPGYDPSGYASCARDYMLYLDRAGVKVRFEPVTFWSPIATPATSGDMFKKLKEFEVTPVSPNCPHVTHMVPDLYKRRMDQHVPVGYTVFETDSLPKQWLEKMQLMKSIWVPCSFNLETFSRAGFDKDKMRVIPHIVPTEHYNPEKHEKMKIPVEKDFYFLTIMDVTHRKGWDILLRAYFREFKNQKDVGLIFKGYFGGVEEVQKRKLLHRLRTFRDELGIKNPPDLIFFGDIIDEKDMPRLYKAAHCYVTPNRGEGWCLPASEAMSMEVPTIGTGWGGPLEFMNEDNSYLIDVLEFREIDDEMTKITPNYKGQKWAEPSEAHLRQLMRQVYTNYKEAKRKARIGRKELVEKFSWQPITERIKDALRELQ